MTQHEVDVVVIGMGPGGESAAGQLAGAGLTVAGVEAGLVGGECPYWGCVPSKMMIRAANLLAEGRRIPGLAGTSVVRPDWAPVAGRIRTEATDDWNDQAAADRFTGQGGLLFRGHGKIIGRGRVVVGDDVLRARRGIVIDTGTVPAIPEVPGLAGTPYWTNREAIEAEHVPESLIVLGGGATALELAQVYSRFGSRVTVLEASGRLLPPEEPEAGELIADVFRREGIDVRTGVKAEQVSHEPGPGAAAGFTLTGPGAAAGFTLALGDGGEVRGNALLVAKGRRADLAAAGTGSVGIDESQHAVPVDGHMRAAPGVWAIGDVVGKGKFTHMSMYHADIVVADILGREHTPAEYHAVPRVTFTDPEIGAVGLTEAQARDRGLAVRTGLAQIPASARGWIHKAGNDGFIKLVEDAGRGVLAGATSAGPWGGEVLSMLTLAVHARVPTQRLREMIYAYPTFHRAVEDALRAL
jgi:pyruvate/2-oxoglutarate dehydrogenase complex dihydrolipoamide dehydrogenase (E3) component